VAHVSLARGAYNPGDTFALNITFRAGTPQNDYSTNPNPGFVDVGATNQSIGPDVTVYDGFTFDMNVAYGGTVHFAGPTGTLKFEQTNFAGVVEGFVSDAEHFDFSAITHGNATVAGPISGSTLDPYSVGWVTNGSDTTIYVNTSDHSEAITSPTDMTVQLHNVQLLHKNDFIV